MVVVYVKSIVRACVRVGMQITIVCCSVIALLLFRRTGLLSSLTYGCSSVVQCLVAVL